MWAVLAIAGALSTVGCSLDGFKTDRSRWLSPDKVIKAPEGPAPVRAIDRNIGVADQDRDRIAGSTLPRVGDFEYSAEDYKIGPGDILDISILDLFHEGLETVLRRQVTESGNIDLPLLKDLVKAENKTQEELKKAIIDDYEPDVLRDPTVSVTIIAQRQNTFSILGSVARTGQYNVVRRSMRVLEALALAGGITQSNIQYIYVIRQRPPRVRAPKKPAKDAKKPSDDKTKPAPLPKIPDGAEGKPAGGKGKPAGAKTKPAGGKGKPADAREQTLLPSPRPAPMLAETGDATPGGKTRGGESPDWRFNTRSNEWEDAPKDGTPRPRGGDAPGRAQSDGLFSVDQDSGSDAVRVIAIDLKKLRNGDPRMNIVVLDKDVMNIPPLELGEFYMAGEVQRPGVYSLTGRKVTVKMAVAAAGNLSPLAWPENSVLIRRIGNASEQVIPLDIEAIFRGEQNDLFLKPNDVLAVGTDIRAPFLAVLRNAFRLTYGFGFIYDRNFGVTSNNSTDRTSSRFTRW